jgi:hypothetical protein
LANHAHEVGVMNKMVANIELHLPGIVIFDLAVLSEFFKQCNVTDSNVFEWFLNDEVLGRSAVEQGVLLPMYPIPEDEYPVFIHIPPDGPQRSLSLCEIRGLPLRVVSGLTVISDLHALLDWDPAFFLDYKSNYAARLASNDYLDVPCGLFNVTVRGYDGLEAPFNPLGYGLEFKPVDILPVVDERVAVDDRHFTLQS